MVVGLSPVAVTLEMVLQDDHYMQALLYLPVIFSSKIDNLGY